VPHRHSLLALHSFIHGRIQQESETFLPGSACISSKHCLWHCAVEIQSNCCYWLWIRKCNQAFESTIFSDLEISRLWRWQS